jgi:hypothetical protein
MDGLIFLHLKNIIGHLVITFLGTIFFFKCQGDDHWAHVTPHPLMQQNSHLQMNYDEP